MTEEDEIYRQMRLYGYKLANRVLPEQERDDAVQTMMVAVCKAMPKLRPETSWIPFMVTVVRQEFGMFLRSYYEHRSAASLWGHADTETPEPPAPGRSPQSGISPRLRAILEDLPERHREAMIECVAEGRTKQQAAALMGVSDVTVGNYIKKALPVLRDRLAA